MTRATWDRLELELLILEIDRESRVTARIVAETDALLAAIAVSREERERSYLELRAVVVGADGPRFV